MRSLLIVYLFVLAQTMVLGQVLQGEVVYLNSGKRSASGISIAGHGTEAGPANHAQGHFHKFTQAKEAFTQYQDRSQSLDKASAVWSFYHAAQNHQQEALDHLKKAVQHGYTNLKFLQEEDAFDCIRRHPKFRRLVRQIERNKAQE